MPWMDLVWCLGGGSSLMKSLLRPLFLPHLIKAMRACHDVSVCLLLWIFMKLFWHPHLAQHLLNTWLNTWFTLAHTAHTWFNTCHTYMALHSAECGSTWNWPRPPLYYPSFPPSPCFLSSYLDCSYFTFSTRWIVDLHERVLPTWPPPYPPYLFNLSPFQHFWVKSKDITDSQRFNRSLYLDGQKKFCTNHHQVDGMLNGCNFFVDDLREVHVI